MNHKRIFGRTGLLIAVLALGATVLVGAVAPVPGHGVFAPHVTAASTTAGATHTSRPLCPPSPNRANCFALAATDAQGHDIKVDPTAASNGVIGYSPQQLHSAYRLPWNSKVRQTIAVIDAYDHPAVKSHLNYYNSAWKLPAFPNCSATVIKACFQRVDQNGANRGFVNSNPAGAKAWNGETDLDVQAAHAICLNCKILLVEAFTDSPADLAAAVNTAAKLGATEISNSYGWAESGLKKWYPAAYSHPGIAITASTHDHGYGAYYPADLNTVIAVGGTKLLLNADGTYKSESVWGDGQNSPNGFGTGSGCSTYTSAYTAAAYWQKNVANWQWTGCGTQRSISDVAAVADPDTGFYTYTIRDDGTTGWTILGGTSLSAPIIAGVFALAGNAGSTDWPALYMYQNQNQFHDVTTGSNGVCDWTIMCNGWTGYDGPTGIGTPWGLGGF